MNLNIAATLPITVIMLTGMLVLIGEALLPTWRKSRNTSPIAALIGIVVAGVMTVQHMVTEENDVLFGGAIMMDSFAYACWLILLVSAALAVGLAMTYLRNKRLNLGEYYALVLFSTFGAMLMACTLELIVLFVALETLSIALYVLAGFARTEERSEESALKYFLLGSFAAGFLLYGIALIYGGSATAQSPGTTNLFALMQVLNAHSVPSVMLMTGIALLFVGLCFKAAIIPFHMWTPDVYEGAPTSVTAYMAATAKIGAFAAFLRVCTAFAPIAPYWLIAIQVLAVLTMFGGNILAVTQDNVKRMLAYSSIAHAGYLLVAVAAATSTKAQESAYSAVTFYLLAYTLMTIGAFAVLIWLSKRGHDVQTIDDLKGLAKIDPPAAYTMLLFMLSLGGIPPTMGFIGKWLIFYSALTAGQAWLAIALALASSISIYYYLRIVWIMCFQEPDADRVKENAVSSLPVRISLLVTAAATLVLGILPNLLSSLTEAAARIAQP